MLEDFVFLNVTEKIKNAYSIWSYNTQQRHDKEDRKSIITTAGKRSACKHIKQQTW